MQYFITHLFLILLVCSTLIAEDGRVYSIPLKVLTSINPQPSIKLVWTEDPTAKKYSVFRKDPSENSWFDQTAWGKEIAVLQSNANSYTDNEVEIGKEYEYQIIRTSEYAKITTINLGNGNDTITQYLGLGYAVAGIDIPPIQYRGKVLIIVDSTIADSLALEIERLKQDLIKELWNVVITQAPRTPVFNSSSIDIVKTIIKVEYDKNPDDLKSILLLGRIAVPYSGDVYPDGHPDHKGAWPADVFYADIDGTWTDDNVNSITATRKENKNEPNDGKFDQSELISDIRIALGRVDFYQMNAFPESEIQLLKRYLDKNHRFRSGQTQPKYAAIIDDNFKAYGEGFSGTPYRGFGPLCGPENINGSGDFFTTDTIMFAYGCGAGSYSSCSGVGATADFATKSVNSVFTMLFGSYFGDWDSENNVMRASLASKGSLLTTCWSARPHWFFHPMGLGRTVGDILITAQNNNQQYLTSVFSTKKYKDGIIYQVDPRGTHISLLGDPTLRMTSNQPLLAPDIIQLSESSDNAITVQWSEGGGKYDGYCVYKSSSIDGPFNQLNSAPITNLTYIDKSAKKGEKAVYQVRTVALRTTASGTYYESSSPVTAQPITVKVNDQPIFVHAPQLKAMPQPATSFAQIHISLPTSSFVNLELCSMQGNSIISIQNGSFEAGEHGFVLNLQEAGLSNISSGMYMLRLKTHTSTVSMPFHIVR